MDSEKLLPEEMQLNLNVLECFEGINDEIDEFRAGELELLDPNLEWNFEESFRVLARYIEEAVLGLEDDALRRSTYRGMVFACEVSLMVYGTEACADIGPYIEKLKASGDRRASYHEDTHHYLAHNPAVHDLLQYHMEELAPKGCHPEHVEKGAALIFMLVERDYGNKYIQGEAEMASIEELLDS